MKDFKSLEQDDRDRLLKYPAFIALLAANKDARIDEAEKAAAEKFLHIKTYSSNPLFAEYYEEADKQFEKNIEELDRKLPADRDARLLSIKYELALLELILEKLDTEYASLMHDSMRSFKEHVSKAHFSVLEYFIFPLPVKGITD
jgi:hypothetical protein